MRGPEIQRDRTSKIAWQRSRMGQSVRLLRPAPRRRQQSSQPGDKVLAYTDVYGGTYRVLKQVFDAYGLVSVFTDNVSPKAFESLIDDQTKIVWLESPTNPLLRCLDITAIADITHKVGALLAVDNTFATPALQLPIDLGADYVVHSTSKYIGGHSDVTGGAVVAKNDALFERILFLQNVFGGVPGPLDCILFSVASRR